MFEPKNEQGTILYFQKICHHLNYEVVSIQAGYPDAIIHDGNNDKDLRVEFEFNSNNFRTHKHDPAGADLVICWKNGGARIGVPILELSTMASYPVDFQQYEAPALPSPAPFPSPLPPRKNNVRTHGVLVVGRRLYIRKMDDDTKVLFFLMASDGKGYEVEAQNDDERQSSRLLWQAEEEAERIREDTKLKSVDEKVGATVLKFYSQALTLRQQGL